MNVRVERLVRHLPIMLNYYKGMFTIEFRIPLYKGIAFNYRYGGERWHTGKHTLMILDIYYPSHWHGWCCGKNKFYHTGLYIGHRKECKANV